MVIERALEKLKQENQAKRRTSRPSAAVATDAARYRPIQPAAPLQPKPVLPLVPLNYSMCEAARVLLPDTGSEDDARPDAAYRMLRTRLLQRMRNSNWTTLALTSPGPGEGKSLSALNLALSMAREKARDVFLFDCDMRNPSLCKYLGVRPPVEILDFFSGHADPSQVMFSIGRENLILAGGTVATDNASELLATDRLETLLEYARSISANPVILLDLPPVLVTDETLLVAPRIDATLLVVAEGRTRRDSLSRAKQLLSDFTLAGVILNRSLETFGADAYYQYRYRDDTPGGT